MVAHLRDAHFILGKKLRQILEMCIRDRRTAEPLHFPVDAHLLHGAGTTLMIDAQGGGYMSRNGVMMTRFLESCQLPSGLRLYLRDSQSGSYWSVTDPILSRAVTLETAQAVFTH